MATTGAIRGAKLQSDHQHQQTNIQHFTDRISFLSPNQQCQSILLILFFFYSILRWSVAVSTMRRQSSRIAAFLQADARPMFCWPSCLPPLHEARCGWIFLTVASNLEAAPGSPQRQHGGGPLVVSCGQYVQRAANVCQ